ncbi:MAG: RDD family protein [Caldilinea sp.]|nr:RDD family protein [Caldilinea sp.]MDW8441200.1 RDD family protein [Caldilineaceae bacterium]
MKNPSDTPSLVDQSEYIISTPENVTFGYFVAGLGSRFIAALIDTSLIVGLLLLLNLLATVLMSWVVDPSTALDTAEIDPGWAAGLVLAVYALLNFTIFWGYYLVFELGWQGQTPGKRLAGIRVVRLDGGVPGFLEVAIRNLVRIVDFLPFAYALGFVVMFLNRQWRRLGDYAAGTLVVYEGSTSQPDFFMRSGARESRQRESPPLAGTVVPEIPNLRRLTGDEYQLICTLLERRMRGQTDSAMMLRLAQAIATKLEVPLPGSTGRDARRFLDSVAEAYRRAAEQS